MNVSNLTKSEQAIIRFITAHRVQAQQSPTIAEVLEYAELLCDDCPDSAKQLIDYMNHEAILNVRPRTLAVTVGQLN